jgi:uncharacterized protein YggE
LLSAPSALAQAPAPPGAPARTITVSGDAVVSAAPDQARVRFGVVTQGETPEGTLSAHEEEVQRVLTAVRNLGIADRQIQLEWVGLNERYGERGPEGFTAHRVVTVTVDDLRQVPELVALVVEEGADQLQGIEYTLRDDDPYENQALEAAMARAREKAERLAQASGATLGGVVAVMERGTQPPPPVPMYRAESLAMDAAPGAYSAGSSEVRAAVVVTFELQD